MIPFRERGSDLVASFERAEVEILDQLASEVSELLGQAAEVDPGSSSERALGRLLPAAYIDDDESDAEFRRFTSDDLVERKQLNAAALRASLADASLADASPDDGRTTVTLDAAAAQSWLRSLTDIRLTLAAALGIEREDDELQHRPEDAYALEVYSWLGFVQESLLDALDR